MQTGTGAARRKNHLGISTAIASLKPIASAKADPSKSFNSISKRFASFGHWKPKRDWPRMRKRRCSLNTSAGVQDYDSDAGKLALFRDVRAGKVRILFGSTQKMGSGTNVQERLIDFHHLDAPWRPADVEQREGRILRQGNKNAVVQIYRYVSEGSFDAYMWQTLETKAKFIAQVMSGDMTIRRLETSTLPR